MNTEAINSIPFNYKVVITFKFEELLFKNRCIQLNGYVCMHAYICVDNSIDQIKIICPPYV